MGSNVARSNLVSSPILLSLRCYHYPDEKSGEATVICGAGPIGLAALAVARASGACPIAITDIDQGRLDFAATFVPGSIPVRVQPEKTPEQMAATVIERLGGSRPRVIYECTGVESSVITACWVPRPGGQVMVIGVGRPKMDGIPFMHISLLEVSCLPVVVIVDALLT